MAANIEGALSVPPPLAERLNAGREVSASTAYRIAEILRFKRNAQEAALSSLHGALVDMLFTQAETYSPTSGPLHLSHLDFTAQVVFDPQHPDTSSLSYAYLATPTSPLSDTEAQQAQQLARKHARALKQVQNAQRAISQFKRHNEPTPAEQRYGHRRSRQVKKQYQRQEGELKAQYDRAYETLQGIREEGYELVQPHTLAIQCQVPNNSSGKPPQANLPTPHERRKKARLTKDGDTVPVDGTKSEQPKTHSKLKKAAGKFLLATTLAATLGGYVVPSVKAVVPMLSGFMQSSEPTPSATPTIDPPVGATTVRSTIYLPIVVKGSGPIVVPTIAPPPTFTPRPSATATPRPSDTAPIPSPTITVTRVTPTEILPSATASATATPEITQTPEVGERYKVTGRITDGGFEGTAYMDVKDVEFTYAGTYQGHHLLTPVDPQFKMHHAWVDASAFSPEDPFELEENQVPKTERTISTSNTMVEFPNIFSFQFSPEGRIWYDNKGFGVQIPFSSISIQEGSRFITLFNSDSLPMGSKYVMYGFEILADGTVNIVRGDDTKPSNNNNYFFEKHVGHINSNDTIGVYFSNGNMYVYKVNPDGSCQALDGSSSEFVYELPEGFSDNSRFMRFYFAGQNAHLTLGKMKALYGFNPDHTSSSSNDPMYDLASGLASDSSFHISDDIFRIQALDVNNIFFGKEVTTPCLMFDTKPYGEYPENYFNTDLTLKPDVQNYFAQAADHGAMLPITFIDEYNNTTGMNIQRYQALVENFAHLGPEIAFMVDSEIDRQGNPRLKITNNAYDNDQHDAVSQLSSFAQQHNRNRPVPYTPSVATLVFRSQIKPYQFPIDDIRSLITHNSNIKYVALVPEQEWLDPNTINMLRDLKDNCNIIYIWRGLHADNIELAIALNDALDQGFQGRFMFGLNSNPNQQPYSLEGETRRYTITRGQGYNKINQAFKQLRERLMHNS